jgi:arsenical-resistance protein
MKFVGPSGSGSMARIAVAADAFETSVIRHLSTLDRFLPVWIGLAMATGLLLARIVPGLSAHFDQVKFDTTSLPIAIGLLGMMYPVLAKVRYDRLGSVTVDRPLLVSSVLLNWLVGPLLTFAPAWVFLPDLPEFRTGVILVDLARCIAMVLIWNSLACGDTEAVAVLVVLNSIYQVAAYSFLGYFYFELVPGSLGLEETAIEIALWDIAKSVLVFLGIPLVLGALTSLIGRRIRGDAWYEGQFLPRIGPWALYSLLFTIVSSPSSSSSPSRGRRSPLGRSTSPASPCRWWPTSGSCGRWPSSGAARRGSATNGRRRWPSRRPGTTSSWPSRWRSAPSGWLGRRWRALSARLPRCRCWWCWCT